MFSSTLIKKSDWVLWKLEKVTLYASLQINDKQHGILKNEHYQGEGSWKDWGAHSLGTHFWGKEHMSI